MATLLKGRLITCSVTFASFLATTLLSALYIYTFAEQFSDTYWLPKTVRVLAMLTTICSAISTLATFHAIYVRTREIGFGLFILLALLSMFFDFCYFGLLVSNNGFDAVCGEKNNGGCGAQGFLVGWSAAIFILDLFRIYAILVCTHYQIRWNLNAPTAAAPPPVTSGPVAPVTSAKSLPKGRAKSTPQAILEVLVPFPVDSGDERYSNDVEEGKRKGGGDATYYELSETHSDSIWDDSEDEEDELSTRKEMRGRKEEAAIPLRHDTNN